MLHEGSPAFGMCFIVRGECEKCTSTAAKSILRRTDERFAKHDYFGTLRRLDPRASGLYIYDRPHTAHCPRTALDPDPWAQARSLCSTSIGCPRAT